MMKRFKIAGCALVAVLAMSGVAAASASAEAPEFGRCKKLTGEKVGMRMVYHGDYTSMTCTVTSPEAKGKYEWYPGVEKTHFTTRLEEGTKVTFETVSKMKITCTGETSSGEYVSPKLEENVVASFTGCEYLEYGGYNVGYIGYPAYSAGAPEGEVVTDSTECELGVVKKGETAAKNMVGLSCAEEDQFMWIKWHGPVYFGFSQENELCIKGWWFFTTAANSMRSGTTATLRSTESKGRQKIEKFEEGPLELLESTLNGASYEQIGLKLTTVQTNEESVEVNSVV